MNDRELLERAAKAAGKDHAWNHRGILLCWSGESSRRLDKPWNPLADDGDAMRLATRLHIHIEWVGGAHSSVDRVQASPKGFGHLAWVEKFKDDPASAARRAIVNVAAAMADLERSRPTTSPNEKEPRSPTL